MAHKVVKIKPTQQDLVELTNSSRSMFRNCQQKYQYAYEQLLTPKQGKGFLVVGNIFHKAHEGLLLSQSITTVQAKIRTDIRTNRKYFIGDSFRFEKDSSIIEGMMLGYSKNQGILKNAIIPKINGKPAVEMPFEVDMGKGVILRGKIDALVKLPDGYWLVEHKTAGRLDANYIMKLPINSQITTYLFAMKYVLPPEIAKKVQGVIYNVVGKTQIRPKKGESESKFMERIVKEYANPANRTKYFYQKKQYRSEAQLRRFEIEAHATAEDIRRCRKTGVWQQNEFFCTYYGTCEFLQICVQGRKPHVMAGFTTRKSAHQETDEEEILDAVTN